MKDSSNRIDIRWRLVAPLLLALAFIVGCGDLPGSPENVVQSAAQAFAEGYNSRDLAQFETYFATPDEGGDAAGLANTKALAEQLLARALADTTFEFRSLDVSAQEIDQANREATVHYRAEISILQNEEPMYAATVEQDVALVQVNGRWLIAGGDEPDVKTTLDTTKLIE